MASTDPEIKDGLGLPVWMKTKPTQEFEPFTASPPPAEDSFFFIRYPKTNMVFNKQKIDQDMSKVLNEKDFGVTTINDREWPKQARICPEMLNAIGTTRISVQPITAKQNSAVDSHADNGFKAEGTSSGMNVQIVPSGSPRGFTVASPGEDLETACAMGAGGRRGSKSLPVTPAHSPTGSPTRRRKNYNRYFTSPFEPVDDGAHRSWLTMALLGYKKDLTTSTSTLAEEDTIENRLGGVSLAESVESLGPAPKSVDPKIVQREMSTQPKQAKPSHSFMPKPSELREMNFWSPTSM